VGVIYHCRYCCRTVQSIILVRVTISGDSSDNNERKVRQRPCFLRLKTENTILLRQVIPKLTIFDNQLTRSSRTQTETGSAYRANNCAPRRTLVAAHSWALSVSGCKRGHSHEHTELWHPYTRSAFTVDDGNKAVATGGSIRATSLTAISAGLQFRPESCPPIRCPTYEMYAQKMYYFEVSTSEINAYWIHTYVIHAYAMYAHKMYTREIRTRKYMPIGCTL
jgi:hypothetical protein